jgi:hypothetical protein
MSQLFSISGGMTPIAKTSAKPITIGMPLRDHDGSIHNVVKIYTNPSDGYENVVLMRERSYDGKTSITKQTTMTGTIKAAGERAGIGFYFADEESEEMYTITPEQITDLLDRYERQCQQEDEEKKAATAEYNRYVELGKAYCRDNKIWVGKEAITLTTMVDNSDPMTDYFNESESDKIVLAFHDKPTVVNVRKAALLYEETYHLGKTLTVYCEGEVHAETNWTHERTYSRSKYLANSFMRGEERVTSHVMSDGIYYEIGKGHYVGNLQKHPLRVFKVQVDWKMVARDNKGNGPKECAFTFVHDFASARPGDEAISFVREKAVKVANLYKRGYSTIPDEDITITILEEYSTEQPVLKEKNTSDFTREGVTSEGVQVLPYKKSFVLVNTNPQMAADLKNFAKEIGERPMWNKFLVDNEGNKFSAWIFFDREKAEIVATKLNDKY